MKKLFLILVFLPVLSFAQRIKSQSTGTIAELKEKTEKYCIISYGRPFISTVQVQGNDDTWEFIDTDTGKKIKFNTSASILNFMEKNGWEYVNSYVNELTYFVFRRKSYNNG